MDEKAPQGPITRSRTTAQSAQAQAAAAQRNTSVAAQRNTSAAAAAQRNTSAAAQSQAAAAGPGVKQTKKETSAAAAGPGVKQTGKETEAETPANIQKYIDDTLKPKIMDNDDVTNAIVDLIVQWPGLADMAGSSNNAMLIVSKNISTIFLDRIQDFLQTEKRGAVRTTLLLGSDTDPECKKARKNAETFNHTDSLVLNYTAEAERKRENPNLRDVSWNKNEYVGVANYVPSGTPTITEFVKAAYGKWEDSTLGEPVKRGNCGDCWLCGNPVYFYKGANGVTGCGQCEHMGAIIGTIISYMTANEQKTDITPDKTEIDTNSAYGYATSHTWCNQRKSDILPMRFTIEERWIPDEVGIGEIAKEMMKLGDSKWYASEYDPLQWQRIKHWTSLDISEGAGLIQYNIICGHIRSGTELWCNHANENLTNLTSGELDLIQQLTRIITFVIEDTTAYYKKGGGPSGGSIGNIYPESVSSSEKITDKNIYKDINKKIDEKIDEKSDEKSNIIDLNNIYNRALGVTIKNKEDLIKVIYDVLTKLYENKNGTYVPMFNKLLTNLKNSLIEKNKSNSKNTIEKYDTSIRDLKVDNNSYVNPINTNNNVLVESRGGKRNTKKRNARKRNTKKRNTKKRNTKKRNTKKRNPKNRK